MGQARCPDERERERERRSVLGMYMRRSLHILVAAKHRTTLAGQSVERFQGDKQTDMPSGGKLKHDKCNSPVYLYPGTQTKG